MRRQQLALVILSMTLVLSLLIACGKKQVAETETAPAEDPSAAEAGAPAGAAKKAYGSRYARQSFEASDKALAKGDYQGAADALLKLDAARMTDQQTLEQVNRMRNLNQKIADAALSGDANAQRAAQLLERYHRMRTGH